MSRVCEFCGKKTEVGYKYARRGLAKYKGGVGRKVTGKTKRRFRPNIQRVLALVDGSVRRVKVCTRCLKGDKVRKPIRKNPFEGVPTTPSVSTED